MNVFTYWEREKPNYINLCLASIEKVCCEGGIRFILVTPENLCNHLPDGVLHENYRLLPQPALRADCIRAALLATHGGWWWDADTVAIRPPNLLSEMYADANALYMTWSNPPRRALNGYIYFPKEHPVARAWLNKINDLLRRNPEEASWCSLGEALLTDMLNDCQDAREIDRRLFLPIDIDSSVATFFSEGDPQAYIEDDTVCFGLNHSWFMYHKPHDMELAPSRWVNSPLLIHQLLQYARDMGGDSA